MLGGQAGILWDGRWETVVRGTWFDRSDRAVGTTYFIGSAPQQVRVLNTPGNRVSLTAQALYHYRHGTSVRPFLGAGMGAIYDSENVLCEVPGCEALLPNLRLGELVHRGGDLVGIGGVAVAMRQNFVIRGGVQLHCPACFETLAVETFVDFGYRFRSR